MLAAPAPSRSGASRTVVLTDPSVGFYTVLVKKQDRIYGGLLGAVVGDALGVPVEFRSREELKKDPLRAMRGWGTHGQPEGTWSDDTSMALCLAESILATGWDLEDQAERFARWAFEHYWTPHGETFDIGGTTGASLDRFRRGASAASCGGSGERDNGNGALMRILPAAVWFSQAPDEMLVRALSAASAVTHAHGRSRLASVFFGLLVRSLLEGMAPGEALRSAGEDIRRLAAEEILDTAMQAELPSLSRILDPSFPELPESAIRSGGYVIDTLEASIWCLARSSSYEECVLAAVNLGGDTDTTGTVAGGLAGIFYGMEALPPAWLQALARREEVESLLGALTELTLRPVPHTASYWVLPGKLLAGEYPRNRERESSEHKLDALLDAGVSACVDLTERGEYGLLPYDELLNARVQLRGSAPDSQSPGRCTTDRFPIPDGGVPTEEAARRAHRMIRERLRAGETVYVHCWGGHGRTGVIVGTWLVDSGLTAPERTQAALAHLRREIDDAHYPSPETKPQITMLLNW
jgi:ADP-ribosyl-[dinitrogen reductase] hydrolase